MIGIHHREGGWSWRWLELCRQRGHAHEVVDAYRSDLIRKLDRFDVFFWAWSHRETRDLTFAHSIIRSVENVGVLVFPDSQTCWHYDDKVAQKYLLESVGAPLVPTYVFYDERSANEWILETSWPKVFKLRRGAGSSNVKLVRTRAEALRFCKQAFDTGFDPTEKVFDDSKTKLRGIKRPSDAIRLIRKLPHGLQKLRTRRKYTAREVGYLYFQDFVDNNEYDVRVTIIGNRAFVFRRKTRPGDFRASGSGMVDFDVSYIDGDCISTAFEVADKIGSQSAAFDFVIDEQGRHLIVEVSYTYMDRVVHECPGHFDRNMNWHEGHTWPQDAVFDDIISRLRT